MWGSFICGLAEAGTRVRSMVLAPRTVWPCVSSSLSVDDVHLHALSSDMGLFQFSAVLKRISMTNWHGYVLKSKNFKQYFVFMVKFRFYISAQKMKKSQACEWITIEKLNKNYWLVKHEKEHTCLSLLLSHICSWKSLKKNSRALTEAQIAS